VPPSAHTAIPLPCTPPTSSRWYNDDTHHASQPGNPSRLKLLPPLPFLSGLNKTNSQTYPKKSTTTTIKIEREYYISREPLMAIVLLLSFGNGWIKILVQGIVMTWSETTSRAIVGVYEPEGGDTTTQKKQQLTMSGLDRPKTRSITSWEPLPLCIL
jgi:hypothetical protein